MIATGAARLAARGATLPLALGWLLGASAPAAAEPALFVLDPEHTSITFFASHLGFADLAGMFLEASGSFRYDEATRELSDLRVVVETASVFTNHARRDEHLRSADFLNVAEFPQMVFAGTAADAARRAQRAGRGRAHAARRDPAADARGVAQQGRPLSLPRRALCARHRRPRHARAQRVRHDLRRGSWVGDEIRLVIGFEAIRQE